jgi:hypothetical protein
LKDGAYLCELKPEYLVPFSIGKGRGKDGTAVIVDEAGSSSAWIRSLQGTLENSFSRIIVMDVFNCGKLRSNIRRPDETAFVARYWHLYGPDNHHAQDAFMADRCPIGLAMEEICAVLNSGGFSGKPLHLIGRGWPALSLLLLSASLKCVRGCVLCVIPESFRMMLDSGHMILNYNYIVPGLLCSTDIPDIIKSIVNVRYAVCAPVTNGSPSVNYGDWNEFPNVRFYSSAGKSVITKVLEYE